MPEFEMVESLPDLISAEEYAAHPGGGLVRLKISVRNGQVEILGDSMRPELVERLLAELGPDVIQQMLCG